MKSPQRPRLLVLSAGSQQVGLIRRAEERGIEVVVADYLENSPGKAFASHSTMASAIDVPACIEVATRYAVDGVITTGTDMPVVTMAEVADRLGLPCYLTPKAALVATDKALMDAALTNAGVRRPKSRIFGAGDAVTLGDLCLPVVAKPVDSQGQRGVTLVEESGDLAGAVSEALSHSRSDSAIVEEFITGPEITVSAWIDDGQVRVLATTDRVTYNPPPALGIAYQHVYPTAHSASVVQDAQNQTLAVARAYGMSNGPLYIQMIVADSGVYVIEAAARVGGGHEAELIPLVAGFDVLDRLIGLALPAEDASRDDTVPEAAAAVVTFLFSEDGIVTRIEGPREGNRSGGRGGFYVNEGSEMTLPRNGTDRVGYVLCTGDSREEALDASAACVASLTFQDAGGTSLLHHPVAEHVLSVG